MFPMRSLFSNADGTTRTNEGPECCSSRHRMPRRHLRVLPTLTRPSLFAGD
jgi:hypothetical protein